MRLLPPFRGVPVDVPDRHVDRYVAMGYVKEKPKPKRSRAKAEKE